MSDELVTTGRRTPAQRSADSETRADVTSERALVLGAALGGHAAWHALVLTHAAAVYEVPRAAGLDPVRAADVSEVTWARLVEVLPDLPPGGVRSWLCAVARSETERALARSAHLAGLPWDGRERRSHRRAGG